MEARIERHLASLLALTGQAPMPSLRLIQAPVFHGHRADAGGGPRRPAPASSARQPAAAAASPPSARIELLRVIFSMRSTLRAVPETGL